MEILYLSRSLLPSTTANSIHVMKMCQALAINGHDVTLVASNNLSNLEEDIFDSYNVKNIFQIRLLPGRIDKTLGLFVYLIRIYIYIKNISPPDFFYGRDLLTLIIATSIHKVPFIYEVHKPPNSPIFSYLTHRLIRNSRLKVMVTITKALKLAMKKRFDPLDSINILVSPDGSDAPSHNMIYKKDKNNKPIIGYVGHLYPGRGIEIIAEIAKILGDYEFQIVGGNLTDINYWRKKCRNLKNIIFKGHFSQKELVNQYNEIDIVLAPYQNRVSIYGGKGDTSLWMSPMKIFEYMSYSKPIIASDLPVLREVLTNGVNALLCKPDCVDDWVTAIRILEEDNVLRSQISKKAFDDFINKYTWEKRAYKIIRACKQNNMAKDYDINGKM